MCKKIPIGTKLKCKICHTKFISMTTVRPREYCSDTCKDFNKYFEAMQRKMYEINFQGTSSNELKREFFIISNNLKLKRND